MSAMLSTTETTIFYTKQCSRNVGKSDCCRTCCTTNRY